MPMDFSAHRTFLDVKRSLGGKRWIERMSPRQANAALEMTQKTDVSEIVARVLAGRDIVTAQVEQFLDPTLRELMPDPHAITDNEAAAGRIARAIYDKEKVAIFGDYDVDGAASSALLARFLRAFGLDVNIHIPDRIFEGYGPNPTAMAQLARQASLIITVDCGTNSAEAFSAIEGSATDFVVIDHHQVGGELPQVVAVVNPNREDDFSGLGHLCAAGVVFMTLVEVARQLKKAGEARSPNLLGYLDLVALATVCDVVPLVGLNRAFVKKGIIVARSRKNPGMVALAASARIGEPLAPYHFGYVLGPRINAGGRIGDASLGAKLLATDDVEEAGQLAAQLDDLNRQRQGAEQVMVEEAKASVAGEMETENPPSVIVVASRDWHPGIVGLIAARLKEAFNRPAVAISIDQNGKGTGSARSVLGFDIGKLVRSAVDEGLLSKGGGHSMAAGLTVASDQIGALRSHFEGKSAEAVTQLTADAVLKLDGALSSGAVSAELVTQLDTVGPYGAGHDQPLFAFPNHIVRFAKIVGNGHLKMSLEGNATRAIDAIAFRAADGPMGQTLLNANGETLHFAGTISMNRFNGREVPQLRVVDVAEPV
ncbi:MAG: single-stranded-DNA-specific exonuclease RecJ [Pseudomonadota bacterium]